MSSIQHAAPVVVACRWRARGAGLIDRVGLNQAAERRVGTYPGGMRRRLDLAMALIHEPQVLFLDAPTTGSLARAPRVRRRRHVGATWPTLLAIGGLVAVIGTTAVRRQGF